MKNSVANTERQDIKNRDAEIGSSKKGLSGGRLVPPYAGPGKGCCHGSQALLFLTGYRGVERGCRKSGSKTFSPKNNLTRSPIGTGTCLIQFSHRRDFQSDHTSIGTPSFSILFPAEPEVCQGRGRIRICHPPKSEKGSE